MLTSANFNCHEVLGQISPNPEHDYNILENLKLPLILFKLDCNITFVCLFCSSDTEDDKAHKNWKKSIMLVWRMAANHKYVLYKAVKII